MKKSIRLLSVLLVLFAGSLVTSCDVAKELAEELAGPEDTWCEMYVEYGNEDKKVSLTVNAIYVEEEYIGRGSSSERDNLSPDITLKPGITFVVSLNSNSSNDLIKGLTSNTYIIKHFDKSSITDTDDDTEGNTGKLSLKGSKTNWSLLYRAKDDLRNKAYQKTLPEAPYIISYRSNSTALTDPEGFSWSKLLKTYLYSTLLGKLE